METFDPSLSLSRHLVRMPEYLYTLPTERRAAPPVPTTNCPDARSPKPMDYNRDAFMQAVRYEDSAFLSRFIEGASRFNPFFACDVDIALREAAGRGKLGIVHGLIDQGATLDVPERCVWRNPAHIHKGPCSDCKGTALQIASSQADSDMVELLLDGGADANFEPNDYGGRTALQVAAEGGHTEVLKTLLAAGANVNGRPCEHYGRTSLQTAAERGNAGMVQRLLAAGADVNSGPCKSYGRTALQAAAEQGHADIVKKLRAAGANVNGEPSSEGGRTALQAAAGGGNEGVVKILLEAGAKVNGEPSYASGRTALQAAAEGGHGGIVKILLAAGADVDAEPSCSSGMTALQAAAEGGHEGVVRILLAAGAEVNGEPSSESGRTALQAAAGGGHAGIVTILLEAGAEVNHEPSSEGGRTALQAAAEGGHEGVVKILLEAAAEVNGEPSCSSGRTALQAAAEGGHAGIVTILLEAGAKVNGEPSYASGRTALQAAAERGHAGIVTILLAGGAEADDKPSSDGGRTALQAAAGVGNEGVIKTLLKAGAKVNGEPSYSSGRTALQAAAEGGHEVVVKILLDAGANVNGAPSYASGRTALQATAGGGNEGVIKTLLEAGAKVNGEPSYSSGRTALQAAAEGGHEVVFKILLDAGANVNGAPSYASGRTALQAAAEGGHEGVVKALLEAGVEVNGNPSRYDKSAPQVVAGQGHADVGGSLLALGAEVGGGPSGEGGRTAMQEAAAGKSFEVASSIPNQSIHLISSHNDPLLISAIASPRVVQHLLQAGLNPSFQDRDGATPLHHAVRGGHTCSAALLLLAGADPSIHDYSNLTPLDLAIEGDRGCRAQLLRILLRFGCDIRGRPIELWRKSFAPTHRSFLTIYEAPSPHPEVAFTLRSKLKGQAAHIDPPQSASLGKKTIEILSLDYLPSVMDASLGPRCLHHPKHDIQTALKEERSIRGLKKRGGHAGCYEEKRPNTSPWRWYRHNPHRTLGGNQEGDGLPTVGTMATDDEFQVILTCYVSLDCWVKSGGQGEGQGTAFGVSARKNGVQWTMRKPPISTQNSAPILRTVDFIGELDIGWVPDDAVNFFNLFIIDLHKKWRYLIEKADIHLHKSRRRLLETQGKSVGFIEDLLADAHIWSDSRSLLQIQVCTARNMVTDFTETQYLQAEVVDFAAAIEKLAGTINKMEEEVSKELDDLDERTQRMIQLEFNLVSIYESRTSKEMGMSMKRLSWATIVFLPLMLVASLFGMNIDIISGGPKWTWVIILAVGFFTVVIFVWSLLKLFLVEEWNRGYQDEARTMSMRANGAYLRPRWGFWRKNKGQEDLEQGAPYAFRRPERVWTTKLKYN